MKPSVERFRPQWPNMKPWNELYKDDPDEASLWSKVYEADPAMAVELIKQSIEGEAFLCAAVSCCGIDWCISTLNRVKRSSNPQKVIDIAFPTPERVSKRNDDD